MDGHWPHERTECHIAADLTRLDCADEILNRLMCSIGDVEMRALVKAARAGIEEIAELLEKRLDDEPTTPPASAG